MVSNFSIRSETIGPFLIQIFVIFARVLKLQGTGLSQYAVYHMSENLLDVMEEYYWFC